MKYYIIGENNEYKHKHHKTHSSANTSFNNLISHIKTHKHKGIHLFLFIYLHGCMPCNQTKPEWDNIVNELKKQLPDNNNNNIIVARVSSTTELKEIGGIGESPTGFPCLRHIYIKGGSPNAVEDYEQSKCIFDKNRTTKSFVDWIRCKSVGILRDSHGQYGGYTKKRVRFKRRNSIRIITKGGSNLRIRRRIKRTQRKTGRRMAN
jgi:hypothetical protein